MRTQGKITFWNDLKGHGFIQPNPRAAKVVRAGEKLPGKTKSNNYSGHVLIALIFMSVVPILSVRFTRATSAA